MSTRAKLFLAGVMFGIGGTVFAAQPRVASAQSELDGDADCVYGSYIVNEKCNGATTRCCKCKIGCPANQE